MEKVGVIAVNGIRTGATSDWFMKFANNMKKIDERMIFFNFNYPYTLGIFSWWIALSKKLYLPSGYRRWMIGRLVSFIEKKQKQNPEIKKWVIVSHSFGGWLSYYAIRREDSIKIDNLILVHCPLPHEIEKTDLWNIMESGRIKKVFVWSSKKDGVIGKVAVWPFGKLGYYGFVRHGIEKDKQTPFEKPYALEVYNDVVSDEDHGGPFKKQAYLSQFQRQILA